MPKKSSLKRDDCWRPEIDRRAALPSNIEKEVKLQFQRDERSITLRVIDQGNGFDWQSFLEIDPERAFDPNGRGIALARLLSFSTLIYEGGGNTAVATISLAENNH